MCQMSAPIPVHPVLPGSFSLAESYLLTWSFLSCDELLDPSVSIKSKNELDLSPLRAKNRPLLVHLCRLLPSIICNE